MDSVHRMIISMNSNQKIQQADIPSAPFFGGRRIALPLSILFAHINRPALFRIGWGAGKASGEKWMRLQADFNDRLERMQHALERENWLAPVATYGYWPCAAALDAIQIFSAADMPDTRILEMPLPRQPFPPFRCLSDFFLPMEEAQRDLAAFQFVSMGARAVDHIQQLQARGDLLEAFYAHGLATQLTEAAAGYVESLIHADLKLEHHRGRRFSWGYEPLPDLAQQVGILRMLDPEDSLHIRFTSAFQIIPEFSTAALFVHHPQAEYFYLTQKDQHAQPTLS